LEALREIYENGIGALFKQVKTGEIFLWRLALTEDWFTIFKSNADNLGKIDGQLSRRIVASYARLKHLIEEFRINNDYVQLREQTAWQLQQLGAAAPPSLVVKGQRIESLMVAQVGRMRQSEQVATDAVQKLFTMLDQEGIR
jgi:hypothetical protein